MTSPDYDPFGEGVSTPAISFKDQPLGTVRSIIVGEYAEKVQSRDFETSEAAFWKDGNPKYSAVLKGTDLDGEPLSLWADMPSSMLTAVREAQEAISKGYRAKPGDRIDVQHHADKPNENPRLNAQKLYRAKITVDFQPPAPKTADPWASEPAQSASAPASTAGFADEPPF
jgi:hypothetical protein